MSRVRCECGFEADGRGLDELIAQIRQHAWDSHGMALAEEDAMRLALTAPDQSPARPAADCRDEKRT
jgi:predicted small metal-binding protein